MQCHELTVNTHLAMLYAPLPPCVSGSSCHFRNCTQRRLNRHTPQGRDRLPFVAQTFVVESLPNTLTTTREAARMPRKARAISSVVGSPHSSLQVSATCRSGINAGMAAGESKPEAIVLDLLFLRRFVDACSNAGAEVSFYGIKAGPTANRVNCLVASVE
jgi:hypothetical protein